jgi:hypothetical protein
MQHKPGGPRDRCRPNSFGLNGAQSAGRIDLLNATVVQILPTDSPKKADLRRSTIGLNRALLRITPVLETRKPFDVLIEGLCSEKSG